MKLLLIADHEERKLWGEWSGEIARKLSDVDIILACGDLSSYYLDHMADKMKVPLVYVPGNHDSAYADRPPNSSCINTDAKITELKAGRGEDAQLVRIIGLGGSMRYKEGPYQYSEEEQSARVNRLIGQLESDRNSEKECTDILLTHAPCRGFGDMNDLPHRGFECFNILLNRWKPKLHCYGHVHREYNDYALGPNEEGYKRLIRHPSGTNLVNGSGYCFVVMGE